MKNLTKIAKLILSEYSQGCLMAPVPEDVYEKIKEVSQDIPLNILQIDKENTIHGIESRPHITIMYGVGDDNNAIEKIKNIFSKPIKIKITNKIDYFDNEDTVAYFKIESDDLMKMNASLQKVFPFKSDYDKYIPHMCIAYLKPGKRIDIDFEPIEFEVNHVVLSKKSGEMLNIYLHGKDSVKIIANEILALKQLKE
jgi:2'-5' RNA ligase